LQHNKVLTRHGGEVVSSGAVYWGGLWFISQPGGDHRTFITGESPSSTMSVHRSIIPASKQQYHNTIYNGILTAIIPLCYLPDR
jgi:hypothetical protein